MGLIKLGRPKNTAEQPVPEPSAFEFQWAIEKLRSHELAGIDQIPAETFKAASRKIRFEIRKVFISLWSKDEWPEKGKQSIIVPLYKKDNKADWSKYRGISILPSMYKILSNILLSRLTPYAEEISGDNQWGFRRNNSATDHILCIRQILAKSEYNERVRQLFIDFKRSYDSVRREVL